MVDVGIGIIALVGAAHRIRNDVLHVVHDVTG